ncbi:3-isopropylmalate dehydrogenase [Aureimonas endophytica]|uniref:AMP nucleosidase n=1 Tax=Aureimonas endophytica TaxID=2027858 RepID=A0A916ZRW1_9HYPH|nr:LOG family protein [Aureimonas endophytica]GGE09958.1 3-isopropylmalate dehydrogenase [Aureimonas endophytica]
MAEREGGERREDGSWDPFPASHEDRQVAKVNPDTPQTRSATYRLAYDDADFLASEAMRGVRLQLELMKPELALKEAGILSTIVLFGGARIPEPGRPAWAARNAGQKARLEANSRYYDEARRFARLASQHSAASSGGREYVIVTGGGPGVMEAGNRGAADVGAVSIALNITLPHEQVPNPYATPELSFNFHYFALRKMHFLFRAKAIAIFPGGFGTMDELFEGLTLIQTGRMARMPVLLFGPDFWRRVLDLDFLAEEGTIAPDDLSLLTFVETAEEGWAAIRAFYGF